MSAAQPYLVSDEDDDTINDSDSELELLDYGKQHYFAYSDSSEPEIISVHNIDTSSASSNASSNSKQGRSSKPLKNGPIRAPYAEIGSYRFNKGCFIKPGDTVELMDHSSHEADSMHSGDFLRIKHIIFNLETDKVKLRGWRMRRTKYLGQIFDWKLNELSLVLHVDEDDQRSPFVAGMEDVSTDDILRPRECVLTNKPYPFQSFRDGPHCSFPASLSKKEIKQQIFHGGRLACRVLNIVIVSKNGKPYSGIIRRLYAKESDTPPSASTPNEPGLSRTSSITVEDDEEDDVVVVSKNKRRARSKSFEIIDPPQRRKVSMPSKPGRYTFGDVFCGAGGSSQGAKQAGLHITWGLDMDEFAICAYHLNHPGAHAFRHNTHEFPPPGWECDELRVDVLHLSPPCCYFSPAHTREGPNDQANMEALFTVGPVLNKVRPRVATLEQTFGLLTFGQHKANFNMLLHDIGKAGYDIRYKLQNLSEFGLVQPRKRLLIIAARRGIPLPPFPKPTHGPAGSGLKPYRLIHDALLPIQRLGFRATNDKYHQTKLAAEPRAPTSPHKFLKGCITTGGAEEYHYSGLRKYTPRELALFQSFPYAYSFTGSNTEAMKQIGNAFPPTMAEALYRTISKTLEAFDNNLIGVEDDLSDLDALLERKGVRLPRAPAVTSSYLA